VNARVLWKPLTRSRVCADHPGIISIKAPMITQEDLATFTALADTQKNPALVFLDSPGGQLAAALEIGLIIKRRGFSTLVDHTRCQSACALIWLAGKHRYMTSSSMLGFHASTDNRTSQISGPGNAMIGTYLYQLGITNWQSMAFFVMADPKSMRWLDPRNAAVANIAVDVFSLNDPSWIWAREKLYPPPATDPVMAFKVLNPPAPVPYHK
jgi:hypothetical protein